MAHSRTCGRARHAKQVIAAQVLKDTEQTLPRQCIQGLRRHLLI